MKRMGPRRAITFIERAARVAVALWRRLRLARSKAARATVFTGELPDVLDPRMVYVVGEGSHLWFVALVCPCGCGETLQMSLHSNGRPQWQVTMHADRTVSLRPSVWRQVGCQSHFFLRRGRVEWCETE